MKTIYIIRHGQTYINQYNKMQGWCDMPLTPLGIKEAKKAGQSLQNVPFDIALSSDLKRANDTCKIIINHNINKNKIRHIATPFFREQFYGFFEGMDCDMAWRIIGGPHGFPTLQDLMNNISINTTKNWIKEADPYHDAENATEYWQRINKGFEIINKINSASHILLVAHGAIIRSFWAKYGNNIPLVPGPRRGSITIMTIDSQGKKEIKAYNKMHL